MIHPVNIANLQFQTVREIGQEGRNSTTHVVHDLQLDAEIVMKKLRKCELKDPAEYFSEARMLYQGSHANVAKILYACEDVDHIYIAMPYYPNGSLKSLMETRFLTVREIVRFGCHVLSGLHNIHSKELIHFDIKPDNLLRTERNEAVLTDFGLAKQTQFGQAAPTMIYGLVSAPEIVDPNSIDLRFDIYQFGFALYRMCVGVDAHRDQVATLGIQTRQELIDAINQLTYPNRAAFPAHIPPRLSKLILKCLSPSKEDRFSSALETANALALVDQCLDWQYFPGDDRRWTRPIEGGECIFTVSQNGTGEFVTVKNGNVRRKKAHCRTNMTEAAVRKVLRDES